jgi:hypothetical protein
MEETFEVYHYSIAEAAELLGCKKSHLLQFAAFSGLPVHVFITDALVDKDGNQKGSFSNYFQLAQMHVRALIANGSIKINPVILMEATPVQVGLGVNYADFVLHHLPLEDGRRTYAVFPETQEITIDANRVVVLAKDMTEFQNKNASKGRAIVASPPVCAPTPRVKPQGGDSLTRIVWDICYDILDAGERPTPVPVMRELKIRAQSTDPKLKEPLVSSTAGGVKYEDADGDEHELNSNQLQSRINAWKKANNVG